MAEGERPLVRLVECYEEDLRVDDVPRVPVRRVVFPVRGEEGVGGLKVLERRVWVGRGRECGGCEEPGGFGLDVGEEGGLEEDVRVGKAAGAVG